MYKRQGLDFASELNSNLIIVVNDNDMSIAENHGGLYKNLKQLRDTDGKSECNLFKSMGLDYVFVKDLSLIHISANMLSHNLSSHSNLRATRRRNMNLSYL